MLLSSLLFVFGFLPISLLLYLFSPKKIKNIVLVLISWVFYAWNHPVLIVILWLTIAWDYVSGRLIAQTHSKKILAISIAYHVAVLGLYKYTGLSQGIPIGLSFFTFSAISYLVDVYRQTSQALLNPVSLSLYISYFGKVTMGPIVSYHDFESELEDRKVSREDFTEGLMQFFVGLFKKVVIADQLALVFQTFNQTQTWLGAWLLTLSYTLQIYYDFSGYSNMAIGLSRMFGFHFKPNFQYPYQAISIQQYWRRWHISLSTWFRDYLYIPLGGSRQGDRKTIRNLMIVWFVTGLWHGANITFILWGMLYGLLLLGERFLYHPAKWPKPLAHSYVWIVTLLIWVPFFSPSISSALGVYGRMIGLGITSIWDSLTLFNLGNFFVLILVACLGVTDHLSQLTNLVWVKGNKRTQSLACVICVVGVILTVCLMVGSTYQTFLYFAF